MNSSKPATVCIVGAGSMGINTGYHLDLAGVDITFLVRPHRQERLSRPQVLYSYDDHNLKTFSGYKLMTDPISLVGSSFDFVIITLDGASLRSDSGKKLVDELGRAFLGTSTAVILGSVGINLRDWFLERSGLAETQVTNGGLGTLAYEVQSANMPLHPGVNSDLIGQADYAYKHVAPFGFSVDLSAPKVAQNFEELYNRSGVSKCAVMSNDEYKILVTAFAPMVAWELLNWEPLSNVDSTNETWKLGVEAMKEFQHISIYDHLANKNISEKTSAEEFLGFFRKMEYDALPLDLAAFNSYHHGKKVKSQDHEILREALTIGEAEGVEMPALRKLIARLPNDKLQT